MAEIEEKKIRMEPYEIAEKHNGSVNNRDPWKNRSEVMKCKACIWFVEKSNSLKSYYDIGRCRRHAPTMNGYPVVFVNDWCGDHKIDERKI